MKLLLRAVTRKGSKSSGWYGPPRGTHTGEAHNAAGSGTSGSGSKGSSWRPLQRGERTGATRMALGEAKDLSKGLGMQASPGIKTGSPVSGTTAEFITHRPQTLVDRRLVDDFGYVQAPGGFFVRDRYRVQTDVSGTGTRVTVEYGASGE